MIPRNCNFCGLCCTLAVRVSEDEIRKIEKGGRRRADFTERDADGNALLKRDEGWCVFFRREKGIGACTIYESRPSRCRDFPGKRTCDLSENVVFRLSKSLPPKVRMLLEKAPRKGDPLPPEKPNFPL